MLRGAFGSFCAGARGRTVLCVGFREADLSPAAPVEATDKAAAIRGALDKMDSLWLLNDCLRNSVSEIGRNSPNLSSVTGQLRSCWGYLHKSS